MSHIATVQCKITDLDALEAAANVKGADLIRNVSTFKSFQQGNRCAHKLKLRDNTEAFEVGVQAAAEGEYTLGYDSWGSHGQALDRAFGSQLVDLRNEYLAVVAEKQLRSQGYMVERAVERAQIRLTAYA